ncbi:hypothetical protein CEP54_015340 [Fusarium duplospermum]|uniref:C3H1-type domain-containing protein n=1 Tax=Fusarium duplospermum TaxID=1325734 RepID=A0A428NPY5_9HYPO|nr:hypothetical protein CEP54_015340 [Fusarium duplospermum]
MADPDPSPELKGPTVAASANQCLESFQQCLISASSVHPREVSMVEDQLARFSSWASSIGVFAQGSASMDHRLRYASEVQSVVTGLLESLNYRVQTCSKTLAQLAESSSTDASTTAKDRLAQSFLDIAAEISRLNKISNTIRRATAEVFDERKWQNHVKNDLDPYVCLFENCDQPDVLYTHSDEWLGHLHQHGKVWRCSSHREMGPFSTLEHYMRHMREVHDTKLSDKQLRVVANRNSRKATKLFQSCPLCGREEAEVDGRLEDHLAGHLRSLALKSLPSYQDEIPDDVADENNSVDGSRPRSRSTLREMEEEKEMLQEEAGSFWDHWTPQLTQSISVNFFGDVYFELDLGDSEARVASLFFDTMVFKESSENLGDDPILQSMLQQQLARIEVIDADTDDSSDLSAQQEAAGSSKAPVGETSGQDEADRTVSQQPVGSEAAGSRAAAPEQDTEIDSPGGDEAPEILVEQKTQASPPTKLDITADAETTSLSNVPTDETSRRDEVDNTAAQGSRSLLMVAKDRCVEKPEVYQEFLKIIRAHEREQTPMRDVYAQIRALADTSPDLSEDEKPVLPESASEGKRDAQPKKQDARPKPGVEHHRPPSLLSTGAATPSQQSQTQDTLCRNVLIYGHCRYEAEGCAFNHDPNRNAGPPLPPPPPPSSQLRQESRVADPSTTTGTYAVTQDPGSYMPNSRDVTRSHRSSSLDSASRPPVIVMSTQKDRPAGTTSQSSNHMEASRASSEISVEAAKAERDYYLQNPYQPASQRRTSSPEGGHRYPPIPEIQTPRPPGASSKASTSLEKDDPPYRKKRASGVYINGQKVLDPDRRDRPLTKGQSPSSSSGKASGGRSYSKQPAGPSMTFDNQASAASTPQAWYTGVPRDSKAHQHDLGSASVPTAIHRQTSDNYYPHPPAERDSFEPQLPPLPPLLPPPRYIYPDDAFEADVEDDIPPPKNPRRKIRPAIYVNGEKVMGLKRENSPVGSLRERIVNVDNPKEQEAAEPVERYKQAELERIATEKAEKDFEEYEKRLRADRAKGERVRSRSPPQLSTTSLTTSNAPPYDTIGPRPVIVEDRPRVEIEIVDGSRSRRPRHASHDPRSVYSFSWDDDDEEQLLERRRERRRQREAEERFGEDQLTIRISDPNADTSGRRPSPYRRPSVQILDPEAKKEGKEKGPSVVDFDSEAELRRAVQRLNAKQEYFRRETAARRLSRKEEGKGKEEEGEQNQPALKDHSIELREATRRLNAMEARREERARKEETEEDEIQRRRLVERMEPRRRDAMSSRRSRPNMIVGNRLRRRVPYYTKGY